MKQRKNHTFTIKQNLFMNEKYSGSVALIIWLIIASVSVLSGVLAWNIIEPESFIGGIGFIIMWGVFSKAAHFIAFAIAASIAIQDTTKQPAYEAPVERHREDPFNSLPQETMVLTRIERPTDKTLSHNYHSGKLGHITFGQSTMNDVHAIWGTPNNVERKWTKSYHAYDKGLTFIATNDPTKIVIGVGVNYDFEPILCVDSHDEDEHDSNRSDLLEDSDLYMEEDAAPIVFAQPMPLRTFMLYFALMEGVNPNDVLKVISDEYAVFEYKVTDDFYGDKTLKLFARRDTVNTTQVAITPIEIIEITDVPSEILRRIPS